MPLKSSIKNDLEIEAIIPALIASIIGYSVFGVWSGWSPIFATSGNLAFTSPPQLLYYVVLGLLCGLMGLLYARGFYSITHLFHRLSLPKWIKPGDVVTFLVSPRGEERLQQYLAERVNTAEPLLVKK